MHRYNNESVAGNNILLDFILSHAHGDERPYLEVYVLEKPLLGLLDSGASCTVVGKPGWEILSKLGLELTGTTSTCTVANGERCTSLGIVSAPIRLRDQIKIIEIMVVPELSHVLILGTNFWKTMGIVPDLRRGEWTFSDTPMLPIEEISSRNNLSPEQESMLNDLVNKMFCGIEEDRIGCTSQVEHEILTDSKPIKQRYYPISPAMQQHVDKELDFMIANSIVEKSRSPWSSPILLVPKKDGTYRFCVDYRKLNQVTHRDAYPLPYVSETLDKLRDAKFLTSLDIKSAYWQIPMAETSKQYTAFTVPNRGLFQFCRMPFGLHNAPATWQRFIDDVIGTDLRPHVFVYLDDIVIVTSTFDKHLEILEIVFSRIRSAGLTLGRDKCQFCREELRYLGYVVNKHGLHVDPEKVKAILDIPLPKCVSDVRRLVGMASWYRQFIPNFSSVLAPLTKLLCKNTRFLWDSDCDNAWSQIKNHLISAPILSCPDFTKEFILQTDASNFGLGAVLSQQHESGEKVICYLSRSLTRQERNFSTTEKELLALLWAIEKLRPYLEGTEFTAITDHYSLLWLNQLENPSGRLARWSVRLQQYKFKILHRKGKEHVVPDALSRAVPVVDSVDVDHVKDNWFRKLFKSVVENPLHYSNYRVNNGRLYKFIRCDYDGLVDDEDQWKEIIPKEKRKQLIHDCHDVPTSGHLGVFKTHRRLLTRFYWPKMKADVARYVRGCVACLRSKPEQKAASGRMGGHSVINKPWEIMCTDLVGPLPATSQGYRYILVISDCFSKFAMFFPLRKASAPAITKILEDQIFLVFGVPRAIISDNGVQFKSKEYKNLLNQYNVKPKYTSYYHPQANPAERINKVLKTMLISYVSENHRTWGNYLAKLGCAIRSATHEVTGLTPNFINFGREIKLSGDWYSNNSIENEMIETPDKDKFEKRSFCFAKLYKDIEKRLHTAYIKSKSRYDLRHRDINFYPNQLVWRKNFVLSDAAQYYTAKLADKYVGPFMIHRKISSHTYQLKNMKDDILPGTWSSKHLKAHPEDDPG